MGSFLERGLTRRTLLKVGGGAFGALVLGAVPHSFFLENLVGAGIAQAESLPPDFYIFVPGAFEGRFYTQTRGEGPYPKGFSVVDGKGAKMWTAFRSHDQVSKWGYPISNTWSDETGRVCQAFQKGIFQITANGAENTQNVEWANIFDELEKRRINLDNLLIPPSYNWDSDRGKPWGHTKEGPNPDTVEENHIKRAFGEISSFPQLKNFYFDNPFWFEQYGLPTGVKDFGAVVVVRCQRAVLQLWKGQTPWTSRPMEVVVANSGEVAKEFGLIPEEATVPQDPPKTVKIETEKYSAGVVVWRGDGKKPYVYLTVDDFWDPKAAEAMLNIADAKGVKLTFFPVGTVVASAPHIFRRVLAGGHGIENHTYTHRWLSNLSDGEIRWEIRKHEEIVRAVTGDDSYTPRFLRPPGGAGIFNYDSRIPRIAQEEGLRVAMWTADSNGWRVHPRTDEEAQVYVMRNIRGGLGNGSIVLQHGVSPDIAVLERLIDEVTGRGFIPITLSQGIE